MFKKSLKLLAKINFYSYLKFVDKIIRGVKFPHNPKEDFYISIEYIFYYLYKVHYTI